MKRIFCTVSLAVIAAFAIGPADAQKAKDTLRMAFADPLNTVVAFDDPKPETRLTTDAVFDTLICYDQKSRDFKPHLAQSWSQVDDKTLELKLRDDVSFHDGEKFSADDVVYTLNWLIDPNNKLRYDDLAWMDHAEKIDAHTVRVIAKHATPLAIVRLAISAHILPAKIHKSFATKADFGRQKPIGTGPYKVVSIDPAAGIVLEKNPDYRLASDCKSAASIGQIKILPIPDEQTRLAQLAIGGLDLAHVERKEDLEIVAANPALTTTAAVSVNFFYMTMDSIARSGNEALKKPEVRRALVQAIDRDLLIKNVIAGAEESERIDAICIPFQRGCVAPDVKPPSYDPAAAKKLLTEAGYPDGFDVEITAIPGSWGLGEAIAGELRKIGVRAAVDKVTFANYRSKQSGGKVQMLVGQWPSLGLPDVAPTMDFYFSGARDYWHDAEIRQWADAAVATLDQGKRDALYRQVFDKVNRLSYILPIATRPDVFVHSKDLVVAKRSMNIYGMALQETHWK